jgi:hypothetical protein
MNAGKTAGRHQKMYAFGPILLKEVNFQIAFPKKSYLSASAFDICHLSKIDTL